MSTQYPWHYEPIRNGRIVVEEIRTETFEFQDLL
jgi:hypothetical protein